SGRGTPDDPADVVHPRLETREPRRLQPRDRLRDTVDGDPPELDLLARGHVRDVASRLPSDLPQQSHLGRGEPAVRHANAHHEVPGRRLALKHAAPLQALLVVVRDRAPTLAREPDQVVLDIEPVALGLEGFDAVHDSPAGEGTLARRTRTAAAFSSG